MAKRTEKLKLQTDQQKLLDYCSKSETFKANLESKAGGIADELEAAGEPVSAATANACWLKTS